MRPPVETVERGDTSAVDAVRDLWLEYWNSLGLAFDFQGFDEELRELPGKYASPSGRLFLVRIDGNSAATAALRPLGNEAGEVKRLYVRPEYRNRGLALQLLARLIEEARQCGYRALYADTLPSMTSAFRLYKRIGFTEVEPYSENPTPDAIYLRLDLDEMRETSRPP